MPEVTPLISERWIKELAATAAVGHIVETDVEQIQALIRQAVAETAEACAKLCDEQENGDHGEPAFYAGTATCAAAIRARLQGK